MDARPLLDAPPARRRPPLLTARGLRALGAVPAVLGALVLLPAVSWAAASSSGDSPAGRVPVAAAAPAAAPVGSELRFLAQLHAAGAPAPEDYLALALGRSACHLRQYGSTAGLPVLADSVQVAPSLRAAVARSAETDLCPAGR